MRSAYMVSYDISDAKRLRETLKIVRGYGDHLQYSVFLCELNPTELIELKDRLRDVIHHEEDQVLFVDIGPAEGRARRALATLGRPYTHTERHALVF